MGIFFTTRAARENKKRYLVYTVRRIMGISRLALAVAAVLAVIVLNAYPPFISRSSLYIFLALVGLLSLNLIVQGIELVPMTLARLRNKEIILRGGVTYLNPKNPPEFWVEQ